MVILESDLNEHCNFGYYISLALGFVFLLGYAVGFRSGMMHCFANIMTVGEIMGKKKESENEAMASAENAVSVMKETS